VTVPPFCILPFAFCILNFLNQKCCTKTILLSNQKLKKMSEELITAKLNEINSIPDLEATSPTIPVSVVLQEAANLYEWCLKDKDILCAAGLDWKLVEDLTARAGALRVSQAKWTSQYKSYQDCQAEWKIAAPVAFNLRDELVHHFYHALYNIPNEYSKVQRIDEGSSNADISELGMKHSEALKTIGMDLSLLDTARAKSFELAGLLAKVNGAITETSPMLAVRNKAYTHLKSALDEIRRVGQYVFWRNDMRLKGYSSVYLRKVNKAYTKKADATAV
jgi:hypothetical protein